LTVGVRVPVGRANLRRRRGCGTDSHRNQGSRGRGVCLFSMIRLMASVCRRWTRQALAMAFAHPQKGSAAAVSRGGVLWRRPVATAVCRRGL